KSLQPSTGKMQERLAHWKKRYADLNAKNALSNPAQQIEQVGEVVRSQKESKADPIRNKKKSIGGFVKIQAENYESALEIAKDCPILELNGSVEVRKFV